MTEYGKVGKPRSRLSNLSHTLWKSLRDYHIPTATATTIMYLKTG